MFFFLAVQVSDVLVSKRFEGFCDACILGKKKKKKQGLDHSTNISFSQNKNGMKHCTCTDKVVTV